MAQVFSGPRVLQVINRVGSEKEPARSPDEKTASRRKRGGCKSELVGISRQSRLELARQMAQISSPDQLAHLTLTYGDQYPTCREQLDQEKRALTTALSRLGCYGFWRLEFQRPRGRDTEFEGKVPHWHCLLWAPQGQNPRDRYVFDRVATWWKKHTCNASDQACFVTPGDEGKALWYMALHAVKTDQSPEFKVGRWWGKIRSGEIARWSRLEMVARALLDRETIWLKRLMRRKTGSRGSLGVQGFTWFLKESDHMRVLKCVHDIVKR